jgi:hypothetical protein
MHATELLSYGSGFCRSTMVVWGPNSVGDSTPVRTSARSIALKRLASLARALLSMLTQPAGCTGPQPRFNRGPGGSVGCSMEEVRALVA